MLFNVYIDGMMNKLDQLDIHSQFYADDGLIIARSDFELTKAIRAV